MSKPREATEVRVGPDRMALRCTVCAHERFFDHHLLLDQVGLLAPPRRTRCFVCARCAAMHWFDDSV